MSMNFDKGPYQTIGTGALAELFKQGNQLHPVDAEPTRPSLFRRLIRLVKPDTKPVKHGNCDEEMTVQPSG